jgi:hypothetical protein
MLGPSDFKQVNFRVRVSLRLLCVRLMIKRVPTSRHSGFAHRLGLKANACHVFTSVVGIVQWKAWV